MVGRRRREIERLYLHAVEAAERTIYIENQYLTADRIAAAIAASMAEPGRPWRW